MNNASVLSRNQLLEKRDHLLKDLRRRRTPGVISAGLGRRDGQNVLTVLVRPSFSGELPETFEGLGVVVTPLSNSSGF